MRNTFKTTAATLALLMTGSVAFAQSGTESSSGAATGSPNATQSDDASSDFRTWDKNADGNVDSTEWDSGWSAGPIFGQMDSDADGNLSEDEYNAYNASRAANAETTGSVSTSNFGNCDVNDDGFLSPVEAGSCTRMGLDASGDGMLDQNEFRSYSSDGDSNSGESTSGTNN